MLTNKVGEWTNAHQEKINKLKQNISPHFLDFHFYMLYDSNYFGFKILKYHVTIIKYYIPN